MATVRIRITYADGTPAAGLDVWAFPAASATILIGGERLKAPPKSNVTDAKGELTFNIRPLSGAQAFHLAAKHHKLMALNQAGDSVPVLSTSQLPRLFGRSLPVESIRIAPASTSQKTIRLVARRMYFVECVHCGQKFRTVATADGQPNRCPNDNQSFVQIEQAAATNPDSFMNPVSGQDPQAAPNAITSRGHTLLFTAVGSVPVYWDESRFVRSDQVRYKLWGLRDNGATEMVEIIGRADWGAGPIVTTLVNNQPRVYSFHTTAQGAAPPYTDAGIPSNENEELRWVLRWATVHHTTDDPLNGFETARALQTKHQVSGIDGSPAADIGYHFVIDANGDIYEGRPLGIKGSHVTRFNGGNVGIVLAGDFERFNQETPSDAAKTSLERLVTCLASRFQIHSVWSHRERNLQATQNVTECPGVRLIPFIETLRQRYPGPPP